MKKIFLLSFLVLLLPSLLALNINLEKENNQGVMVHGIDAPAVFNLKITNLDRNMELKFMNFLGFVIEPEIVEIKEDETKEIQFKVYPKANFNYLGYYIFKYSIFKGEERLDDELILKLIEFKDTFEIGAQEIDPESSSLEVYVKNKENFNFKELNVKFSSAFFELEEDFKLGPNEKKSFSVNLNKEDFKKLIAGFYTLNAEITSANEKANLEGVIKFLEKDIVTTEKKEYGFIISSKIIKKENKGNVIVETQTTIKKNIISRLFTSFSPEPGTIERKDSYVYYIWNQSIKPGETLEIVVKTNWLFPFILVLIIVLIIIVVKQSSKKNLVIKKKVSLVKSKGGEFALKVTLNLHARKYMERIRLIDRLPPLVKIYEKFGIEKPIKTDEKNKRIEWAFEKLEAGETRTISYVIYSKVGILGRFILPSAIAIFERNGKICKETSNKSFLMAETSGK
ncbi:MAG: hypothetical protein ABFQ65_00235 [Nanoarchaeota archaeon]